MTRECQLERINALADASPGFVWRLRTAAPPEVDAEFCGEAARSGIP
jgi:hypothetical protein